MKTLVIYGDGVHDDTKALEAIANGKAKGIYPNGQPFPSTNSVCRITRPIKVKT